MAIDWLQTGVIVAAAGIAYMWFFRDKRSEEPEEEVPDFPEPENKDMTLAELSKYNGRSEEVEKRIYIGIAGKIYDVTTRPGFYGPDGPYNVFTGHDATYALARGTLDLEDMDLVNPPPLKRYEYYALQDWLGTYARYHVVGNLIDRPAPEVEPSKIVKKEKKAAVPAPSAETEKVADSSASASAPAEPASGDSVAEEAKTDEKVKSETSVQAEETNGEKATQSEKSGAAPVAGEVAQPTTGNDDIAEDNSRD